MKSIHGLPMKCADSACRASLLLVLLALIQVTPTRGEVQPQTVEEAFAAYAEAAGEKVKPDELSTAVEFPVQEARFVRLVIVRTHAGAPCIDELEVYGPDSQTNLALASRGAVSRASSLLPGHAIHAIPHLNDGLYGNDHSWIANTAGDEWAEIELPASVPVGAWSFCAIATDSTLIGRSWRRKFVYRRTARSGRPQQDSRGPWDNCHRLCRS